MYGFIDVDSRTEASSMSLILLRLASMISLSSSTPLNVQWYVNALFVLLNVTLSVLMQLMNGVGQKRRVYRLASREARSSIDS